MKHFFERPKEVEEMFAKRPYAAVGETELLPELMGVLNLMPFIKHCSYMRAQMASTHITQAPTIQRSELPAVLSGMEYEYGKTTTSIMSPNKRCRVLRVIHRFNSSGGGENASISENPESLIIYQELDEARLGVIELPRYYSHHTLFTHEYVPETAILQRIFSKGQDVILEPNTMLYRSPNLDKNGYYSPSGRNLNVAFLSLAGIADDGIIFRKGALEDFAYTKIIKVGFEFGYDKFPANTYGNTDVYKPFPDIGDSIREDGLVCALVKYDPDTAFFQQNIHGLMQPDLNGDAELRFAQPGGKVIGINIISDMHGTHRGLPEGMERNFSKYLNSERRAMRELYAVYQAAKQQNRNIELTPKLRVLLRTAIAKLRAAGENVGFPSKNKAECFRYKDELLDQYRVEITIAYKTIPFLAHKFSNYHASKGVLVQEWDDDKMPRDDFGNVVDVIMSPNSVINRKNPSFLFELTTTAASRDVANRVRERLTNGECQWGKLIPKHVAKTLLEELWTKNEQLVREVNDYVMGFYRDVAPMHWHDLVTDHGEVQNKEFIFEHLMYIMTQCDRYISLKIPTNDPLTGSQRAEMLLKKYPSVRTPVTYVTPEGKVERTKKPVRIGTAYTILLEKITTDTYGAQNLGSPQIHGVLSNPGGVRRQYLPYRANSTRMTGELEIQMMTHLGSAEGVVELSDLSNNPNLFGHMADRIMTAENPAQMDSFIDRTIYPYGQSLLRNRVDSILSACGIEMAIKDYEQEPKPPGFMEGCGLTSSFTGQPIDFTEETKEMFNKIRQQAI